MDMSYTKPQVTIDLDEYNALTTKVKDSDGEMWLLVAQMILLAASMTGSISRPMISKLQDAGILFTVPPDHNYIVSPKDVKIQYSPPKPK
jgi:hypothetical protein